MVICCALLTVFAGCVQHIKEPSSAGSFYPADAGELQAAVTGLLDTADVSAENGRLVALIVPHAGYRYSGATAARAIKHLGERDIRTVIILGASHYQTFPGASVYAQGGMRTPLGIMQVNEEMARFLLDEKAAVTNRPEYFEKEHVIEAVLPLLQGVDKGMQIVPVLTGALSQESFVYLVKKLVLIMRTDPSAMLIASADLSHYQNYDKAVAMDRKLIGAIERMSVDDVEGYLAGGESGTCGRSVLLLTMAAASELGANSGKLYHYSNTGDVTGDPRSVVGYAAMGLYKRGLDPEEKMTLLALAKKTIEDYVTFGSAADVEIGAPRMNSYGTTFVTINHKGQMRGCIGNVRNPMPLYKSVILNAIAAGSKDPRFPPVKKEELKDLEVEVSVLSAFEPVNDISEIELGRHGLYLVKGSHAATLLPQVASEAGWDVFMYLGKLAIKAGLPPEAWKDAQLFKFTAEVIK